MHVFKDSMWWDEKEIFGTKQDQKIFLEVINRAKERKAS
jgi:hypothetical protein